VRSSFRVRAPDGSGKLLTLVSDEAIAHIGGNIPGREAEGRFRRDLRHPDPRRRREGAGEIVPAAKLKLREDGAMTTEDYTGGTVWLKEIGAEVGLAVPARGYRS